MVKALGEKKVVVNKIKIKESKTQSIQTQLQSFAFQDPELKYLGQRVSLSILTFRLRLRRVSFLFVSSRRSSHLTRGSSSLRSQAFISYLKSVYIQKNKEVFSVGSLPVEKFAESLGLPGAPQIKFISQEQAKKKKNRVKVVEVRGDEVESGDEKETVLVSLVSFFLRFFMTPFRVSSPVEEAPFTIADPFRLSWSTFPSLPASVIDSSSRRPNKVRPNVRKEEPKHPF